ncbi:cytochrome d ubiquinol oxidase subunit II [Streptomyces sp. SID14515]|uniref:cytochrome d ubiquinol oxidase subunit II n=1 Tax=Streptomyces sp. SID14515 TaxID=2706074 RepID=UPI0013C9C222|nr:cytochrome d ubiquinol oxidase subunit II [Streptomyces sp. SID14515]NEB37523.1 cytochrome d ubiquinol oxidase subunit II [Streptomyces sp. SID14515]
MSTSDQDQHRDERRDEREAGREDGLNDEQSDQDRGADAPIADTAVKTEAEVEAEPEAAPGTATGAGTDELDDVPVGQDGKRLTPRQARRLRIVLSSVGMAAMAVVLGLRIASRSSVLVVGVYGLALILCGVVIELSRNGRTRLASWLLGAGLLAAVGADWLLLP